MRSWCIIRRRSILIRDTNDGMTTESPILNGVRVFGSSTLRVAPDTATIAIAVSRVEPLPKDAFASAHLGAASVLQFLTTHKAGEFGSSRITLSQELRFIQSEQRFMGYKARVGYSITLRDLGRLEEVLTGAISAGANELTSVQFETSELKKLRGQARKEAVAAAREKAELYCREARVALGRVMAIEDGRPTV
jgi:uncharacterized protein YggE